MGKEAPLFRVTVRAMRVTVSEITPGARGYATADRKKVLRERDALELFYDLKAGTAHVGGSYYFKKPDIAKTFAMLCLKDIQQTVEDNLDEVQNFRSD